MELDDAPLSDNPQETSRSHHHSVDATVALNRYLPLPSKATLLWLGLVRGSNGGHYCLVCRETLDTSCSLKPCLIHVFHPTHLRNVAQKTVDCFGDVSPHIAQTFLSELVDSIVSDALSLDQKQLIVGKLYSSTQSGNPVTRKDSLIFGRTHDIGSRVGSSLHVNASIGPGTRKVVTSFRRQCHPLVCGENRRVITKSKWERRRSRSQMTPHAVAALSADALADQLAVMLCIEPFQNNLRSLAEALPSLESFGTSETNQGVHTPKNVASSAG